MQFSALGEVHTDLSNSSGGDTDELNISPVTIEVTLSDGRKISLTIQGEKGATISGLYKLEQASEASYTATINMRNSIFDRFAKSLATEEGTRATGLCNQSYGRYGDKSIFWGWGSKWSILQK